MAYQPLYDHAYFMATGRVQKASENFAEKTNDEGPLWQYNNLP
jgi:hypothetical protein